MWATDGLESRYNPRRAAEKQKEKGCGVVSGYKQATPTGFGDLERSIGSIRNPPAVIAHPVDVPVTAFYGGSGNASKGSIHLSSVSRIE